MRLYTVGLVATLALALLMVPLASAAQRAEKVPQVGVLTPNVGPAMSFFHETLRQGLHELVLCQDEIIG